MKITKNEVTEINDLLGSAFAAVALQLDSTKNENKEILSALGAELQKIRDLVKGN